jgi:hypothetical protein
VCVRRAVLKTDRSDRGKGAAAAWRGGGGGGGRCTAEYMGEVLAQSQSDRIGGSGGNSYTAGSWLVACDRQPVEATDGWTGTDTAAAHRQANRARLERCCLCRNLRISR